MGTSGIDVSEYTYNVADESQSGLYPEYNTRPLWN